MDKNISYLVPSYNHGKYLLTLLESIKSDIQCLSVSSEIVIVDDGSTDNSAEIIRTWVKNNNVCIHINVYISSINKGITATFNKLVAMSNGKFLRFSGSDDIIVQGSTQKLFDVLFVSSILICTFGDATVIDGEGNVIHKSSITYHGGSITKILNTKKISYELINNWCIAGPSILIKKSHYRDMKYDETLKIDDFDLILSILEKPDTVLFINCIVCNYRVHGANTSKTKDITKRLENLLSFLQIIDKYSHRGFLKNALVSVRYKTIAKIYFLKKSYFLSLKYLIKNFLIVLKSKFCGLSK